MGKAVAKAVIRADNRKLRGDLSRSRKMFKGAFTGIGRGIKGTLSGALSPLGVGVGALGFAAIGKEVLDFEQVLTDIEIQGDASSKTMAGLRGTIDDLSKSNAIGKTELSALALEMVNLEGKAGLNAEKLKVLGDAAFATSAPVQELAGLSLALGNAFDLTDAAGLRKGLDGIITAGKEGSIPLNEMNLLLQQNGASFAKFAKTGSEGAGQMAATLQALRKDAGSAGEAGTRLGAILGIFQTRELELKKANIEVKDQAGNYRELSAIIDDIDQSGLVRDAKKFKEAFGTRKEARLALDSLLNRKQLIQDITEATKEGGTIEADSARRRESDSFKIKKAFNDIKLTIAEAFTPDRIRKFASAMGKVAKLVGFIADNIEAFVLLLAALKIRSIAAGFQSMAASSGVMSKNAALTSGAMGKVGAAASVAGAAIAGWQLGKALDEALGISDAISNLALPDAEDQKRFDSGFLREQSQKLNQERGAQARRGGDLSFEEQQQSIVRARRIVATATEGGIIGEGGDISRNRAFTAQTGKDAPGGLFTSRTETAINQAATDQLVSAIRQAQTLVSGTEKLGKQGVAVQISVDERGLLKAMALAGQEARRAPQ